MDLEKWFFPDKVPGQMLYLGERRSLLLGGNGHQNWREMASFPHTLGEFSSLTYLPGAKPGPLGLSINANPFVFNLFPFDTPLPLNRKKRNELIQWRLQRVFPDATSDQFHQYMVFKRKMVFSTLIPREILANLEQHFQSLGFVVTYITCTTVDALQNASSVSREALLLLELEGQLLMVTLIDKGQPQFVRKIRFSQARELLPALRKTVAFASEQQGIVPKFFLCNELTGADYTELSADLAEMSLKPLTLVPSRRCLFLP